MYSRKGEQAQELLNSGVRVCLKLNAKKTEVITFTGTSTSDNNRRHCPGGRQGFEVPGLMDHAWRALNDQCTEL